MAAGRYLVTRPYAESGIGSNLASLAGAVDVARDCGRTLIVDWRGLDVLVNTSMNYFGEFFDAPHEIDGVEILVAGADSVPEHVGAPPDECSWLGANEARTRRAADSPRFFVVQPYHGLDRIAATRDPVESHRFVKRVYQA